MARLIVHRGNAIRTENFSPRMQEIFRERTRIYLDRLRQARIAREARIARMNAVRAVLNGDPA